MGDSHCKVSGLVQSDARDRVSGIIGPSGTLDSTLVALSLLPPNANVKSGQAVVTSGSGGVFPPGIPRRNDRGFAFGGLWAFDRGEGEAGRKFERVGRGLGDCEAITWLNTIILLMVTVLAVYWKALLAVCAISWARRLTCFRPSWSMRAYMGVLAPFDGRRRRRAFV